MLIFNGISRRECRYSADAESCGYGRNKVFKVKRERICTVKKILQVGIKDVSLGYLRGIYTLYKVKVI